MKNYKNNFKKNRFRSNGERSYRRNGQNSKFVSYSDNSDFQRKKVGRNFNAVKLIEKYTELAKEALSNGDKILSENYNQHADHFIRISEKQSVEKINKNLSNDEPDIQISDNNKKDQENIDLK
tara:strand:+ start:133 stop:501 length:369 start_codon:yes stop_codon:yes gene_type:complete